MAKRSLFSEKLGRPVAPYCHVAVAGGLGFVSGMLSVDLSTGKPVFDDIQSQTTRILDNMTLLLEDLGWTLKDVAKVTIFLTDMGDFGAVNEVYGRYFADEPPARSCIQVAALPLGADIEIEAIIGTG
ncbi:MAG: reactive intermediate/imine deaminase [candidate division WS1 bacterium]|jgi:2-iminobutanoate/2-iminopropanoate deaminase|nr:reactive intermediate/imine deaminase [candidate division WS1 bacterium]